jgi:CarD family transcriptional regulator
MMASADAAVAAKDDNVLAADALSADGDNPVVAAPPAAKKALRPATEADTAVAIEGGEAPPATVVGAPPATTPPRAMNQPSGMRPGQHGGPTQIPRMPAKAEIFVEGDHVVYPTHGVGKVERIATEEIAGHRLELIHITFEENRMTLRVPVSKARSAGLRKLATRKMFDDALAVLKGRARIKRTMWSRRAQEYEAKINSGDPMAIAEVVRDLHRNAGQPDQSFSERQIYEAAMDRLAAELAALDKTDKPTAVAKLTEFLKTV